MTEEARDWSLLVGRKVELKRNGKLIRTAEVEDASLDSSILWLRFDGAYGRQLITTTDGYEVHAFD